MRVQEIVISMYINFYLLVKYKNRSFINYTMPFNVMVAFCKCNCFCECQCMMKCVFPMFEGKYPPEKNKTLELSTFLMLNAFLGTETYVYYTKLHQPSNDIRVTVTNCTVHRLMKHGIKMLIIAKNYNFLKCDWCINCCILS